MATTTSTSNQVEYYQPVPRYDRWLETVDLPIHRGYFIDDMRTIDVKPWDERGCNAALIALAGQEGVSEARITEIPPGATTVPFKFGLDEMVYVLQGRGLTTIWGADSSKKRTFEWQPYSLFNLPRNYTYQLSNAQGHQPCRLLHVNTLPLAMALIPEPSYFFNNPNNLPDYDLMDESGEFYSEARYVEGSGRWVGNFFPNLMAWDKVKAQHGRGAGASSASLVMPHTAFRVGLPTMPVGTYKKAHWHGPGIVIAIPGGSEGFSVMWPEGKEKQYCFWHEGSAFVPPNHWWHQHFNVGGAPARYITMHPPRHPLFGGGRQGEEAANEPNIEYPDEDPNIRNTFEAELAKRGVKILMPSGCYTDYNFKWPQELDLEHE